MLESIKIGNYLSFKKPVLLDFKATNIRDKKEDNLILHKKSKLLKSIVFYGANSSGKSNFIKGINFMKWYVINSSKATQSEEEIDISQFKLDNESESKPSYFELVFLINEFKYRYGFEVNNKEIITEWLLFSKINKEKFLFLREKDNIEINSKLFKEGSGLEEKTRNNALFLSVCAQFNGNVSKSILEWFTNLNIIHGIRDSTYEFVTLSMMKNPEHFSKIMDFVSLADMNINKILQKDLDIKAENLNKDIPLEIRKRLEKELEKEIGPKGKLKSILTVHNKHDENYNIIGEVNLSLDSEESEGTKKYFRISGPIIDTLINGKILIIDELDAKLHPILTNAIVKLFNSKNTNSNNAQLIFTTHDTNLLNSCNFRRDQIWFMEKNQGEETEIFSLVDYIVPSKRKKIRNDESYEKNYIKGKYGAVPFIGDFSKLFINNGSQK